MTAALLLDVRRALGVRLGGAGRWLAAADLAVLVGLGGLRWRTFLGWCAAHPAHLSRGAQHRVAARLEALGARQPRLLSSYFHGVLEFVSAGRLRMVYLAEQGFDPRRVEDWEALLRRTAGAPADYIFCVERFRFDRATQGTPMIHERFLRALRASGRRLEGRWELGAAEGRPAFLLLRVAAGPGAVPSARQRPATPPSGVVP